MGTSWKELRQCLFGPHQDDLITIKKRSVQEEMEALKTSKHRSIRYPDYFSREDEAIVRSCAEACGLHALKHNQELVVKKRDPRSKYPAKTLQLFAPDVASPRSTEELAVNVPELAAHGRESFIKTLRLRRMDSAGGNRSSMLWEVAKSSNRLSPVQDGCGGVYAMQSSDGERLAMFKPIEEERFVREGLEAGEGAIREEAAYVLDSRSGGLSGVPPAL